MAGEVEEDEVVAEVEGEGAVAKVVEAFRVLRAAVAAEKSRGLPGDLDPLVVHVPVAAHGPVGVGVRVVEVEVVGATFRVPREVGVEDPAAAIFPARRAEAGARRNCPLVAAVCPPVRGSDPAAAIALPWAVELHNCLPAIGLAQAREIALRSCLLDRVESIDLAVLIARAERIVPEAELPIVLRSCLTSRGPASQIAQGPGRDSDRAKAISETSSGLPAARRVVPHWAAPSVEHSVTVHRSSRRTALESVTGQGSVTGQELVIGRESVIALALAIDRVGSVLRAQSSVRTGGIGRRTGAKVGRTA